MTAPTPIRLLIVADDVEDRKQLEGLLAQSSHDGYEVRCADRLASALELLRDHPFDLILLDPGLPDSHGMDSIERLQTQAPEVPIVVFGGLDDESMATRAVQTGVQDYLIKGQVDGRLLMRSIRYALERKKVERRCQAAERRYRTIFENSAVAIMVVNKEGSLVSWNQFTEHLLGMGKDDLLARDVRSLYPPSEWQRICAMNLRRKGMQHHLETKMIRGDGEIIDVDISLSVVQDSDEGISGSVGVVRDITERKRMGEALRRSERRFRQVVENAREWIWEVDADGLYTYASPVVEKILGYKVEEILGKRHLNDFFHPDDAAQLKARSREIFERKDVFSEFQARSVRKDGVVVWLLRSGVPILDKEGRLLGYRGADADITERMRTHEILDRKQKNLEAIFDAAPLGMLLLDEELRVVRANDAIRQMSGKGYPNLIHHDVCQALACTRSVEFSECAEATRSCEGCSLRNLISTTLASGQAIRGREIRPSLSSSDEPFRPWLSASVEPVNLDEGKHVLVALNDVTDRKRAEEELKAAMEMKAQFISTVSHELRTPLTAIREAVIIVLDGVAGKIKKDQRHFLDLAKRNIDRLARLIDDVLDFQKLNAGKMKFDMRESGIANAVEEACTTMRPHAQKNGIDLVVELEANLPSVVFDSDRIIQALANLISNAIKFTPEGGRVQVSAHHRNENVVIKIRDTGLGIPKEDLPHVFDRFYRVQRPGKEIKGTGLGLPIVSRIIASHGGRIEVESELDKGSTFTVILPVSRQDMSAAVSEQTDQSVEAILAET